MFKGGDHKMQGYLLLDMTGSMRANKQSTIDACNEYIYGLKANQQGQFDFSITQDIASADDWTIDSIDEGHRLVGGHNESPVRHLKGQASDSEEENQW